MTAFPVPTTYDSTEFYMDRNARIAAAIADLESQDRPNIAATAKKWQVARETLSKRFRGETGTIEDANSNSRQQLTTTQEESLIEYINKLSDRGFPPTPQILKNIAEGIAKSKLGKNWVSRFCSRNQERIKSIYLRTIDHKRKIADNSEYFQHFYNTVSLSVILNELYEVRILLYISVNVFT
jgi:hypothetical protein